LITGKR